MATGVKSYKKIAGVATTASLLGIYWQIIILTITLFNDILLNK